MLDVGCWMIPSTQSETYSMYNCEAYVMSDGEVFIISDGEMQSTCDCEL